MVWRQLVLISLLFAGCSRLHNVQFDDIDQTQRGEPFEVVVSEAGFNTNQIAEGAQWTHKIANAGKKSEEIEQIRIILEIMQFGPKTGNPVFDDSFTDHVEERILSKCPSGKVVNLVCTRESVESAFVSGEIVRIKGECLQ